MNIHKAIKAITNNRKKMSRGVQHYNAPYSRERIFIKDSGAIMLIKGTNYASMVLEMVRPHRVKISDYDDGHYYITVNELEKANLI